jgi:acyl-CoA thioesterase-1
MSMVRLRCTRLLPRVFLIALTLGSGCGKNEGGRTGAQGRRLSPGTEAASAGESAGTRAGTVLFLGTSLTAGYGLDPEQAYPAILERKIREAGLPYRVVNAGVSGETSAGALRRLDWLLRQPFDVLVLETGANDMLRGADLDSTRANIQAILDRIRGDRPEARIVLVGLRAPRNLGPAYAARFRAMYADLARENRVAFVPYLLEGVGGRSDLNLTDGIHPNAAGQEKVAENVWKVLKEELRR